MTMEEIREQYPHPIKANSMRHHSGEYCVGGACMVTVHPGWTMYWAFPDSITLSRILQKLNPALCAIDALDYADMILDENDAGRFANAWQVVALALKEGA